MSPHRIHLGAISYIIKAPKNIPHTRLSPHSIIRDLQRSGFKQVLQTKEKKVQIASLMPPKRKPILSPGKLKPNAQYSIRGFTARKKTDNRASPQKTLSYNRFESLAQEEPDKDQQDDSSTSSSSTSVIDNTVTAAASLSVVSNKTDTFDIDSTVDFPTLKGNLIRNHSREERIDTIIVGGDRSDLPQRKRADENKGVTDDDLYPSTPTNTAKKNTYEPPNLRRETEFTSSSIASTAGSKIVLGTETPKTNNQVREEP